MTHLKKIEEEVTSWPNISIHPHRFQAREFRIGNAELGHVHEGGVVDIPFPRPVRDFLLAEGLAQEHHWVPNSGWTTFHVRNQEDLNHAIWLLRLSYLRYILKTADDPRNLLDRESQSLHLHPSLKSLFEAFLPAAKPVLAQRPTA
jgi:hypothetical protein